MKKEILRIEYLSHGIPSKVFPETLVEALDMVDMLSNFSWITEIKIIDKEESK